MLKNSELKDINKAIVTLSIVREYALDPETTNFYDKTHITTLDIDHRIKELSRIYAGYSLQKKIHSKKSNEYNKAHPEIHRRNNRAYEQRKREKLKGGDM